MSSSSRKPDEDFTTFDVNELAKPLNLSTDGNPFDMDAILDAIPKERTGLKYTDGWDPTRLDEELKNHPFFMKEMPAEGEPLPPLLQALQQLKYSETDNTPEELALNYKEDGNFHFKLKKYRVAIACFTEAIRKATSTEEMKQNNELIAQLYNNRAASQFHIENYRSCLLDCEKSIEYKRDYFKPIFKAIEAFIKLRKWSKALEFCEKGEKLEPMNSEVQRLRLLAVRNMKLRNASDRKNEFTKRGKVKMYEEIMNQVKERKIQCRNPSFLNYETGETGKHVKIGEDGRLKWPIFLCYPQFSQSDYIEAFHEDSTFLDHLNEILENERPAWDKKDEYHSSTVDIYYISFQTCGYVKVGTLQTLREVLETKLYQLPANGIPTFFVMARNEMCKVLYERVQTAAIKT